jgi:4-hydroxy-3-methylbut-2-enyl diphosphate reductase
MNIKFLEGDIGMKDYSTVKEGDVVILPAFGATIQEMQLLDERNAKIVDTTCPWVSKVTLS